MSDDNSSNEAITSLPSLCPAQQPDQFSPVLADSGCRVDHHDTSQLSLLPADIAGATHMTQAQPLVWLVTGANRGIGYEYVKQLLSIPQYLVVATARDPSRASELQNLAAGADRLLVVPLEVTDEASAQEAARLVEQKYGHLDYLISNAGIARVSGDGTEGHIFGVQHGHETAEPVSSMETIFRVNTIGCIILMRAFLPLLSKGTRKTVVHISSGSGSISLHAKAAVGKEPVSLIAKSWPGYAISKAASNMAVASIGAQLRDEGFIVMSMHPGRTDTDMARASGEVPGLPPPMSPEESIQQQLQVIHSLTTADNGSFKSYTGEHIDF